MPQQLAEIPLYLDTVDKIYAEYGVPDDIKISLLNPYLSPAARKMVVTLQGDVATDYDKFKTAVLREFALTPNKYRDFFWNAVKTADETYTQYGTRLKALFSYYLSSREVDEFDELKELIIADKLKSGLSGQILKDVNKRECDEYFSLHELCIFSDRCVNVLQEANSVNNLKPYDKKNVKHDYLKRKSSGRCYSCGATDHYSNEPICPNFR